MAQQHGGDVGGAATAGIRRGAPQHARRPRLAGSLRGKQLRGDEPDVGAAGVEHPGGPQMQRRALRRGDTGERGDAQERVAPRERHGIVEQRRGRQLARRGRRVLLGEPGEGARVGQPGLVAENRRRARQAPRRLGNRRQAQA